MTDAFEKVRHDGKVVDRKTKAFLQAMEEKLGYELTVVQGSYNPGGVGASGGTHDKGGVVDLAPFDHERKVRVAKELGAFAWYRPAIKGLWGEHIHLGIRNHGNLAPAAQVQQRAYDNRRNGLKSNLADNTWRPPRPVTFQYPVKRVPVPPPPSNVSVARSHLTEALTVLSRAQTRLERAPKSRVNVREQIPVIQRMRTQIGAVLKELPKR